MKSVGPQPLPHQWVGYYYCRPCNKVIDNVGQHVPTCGALQQHMLRTGKTLDEALRRLAPRECPDCYLGFRGKDYCPTCGNRREPPLDDSGRRMVFGVPSLQGKELAEAIASTAPLEVGQWYEIKMVTRHGAKGVPEATEWITAKCIGIHGPIILLTDVPYGSRGVWKQHQLGMKEWRPVEPDGEEVVWEQAADVETCTECGHPEHGRIKCAHRSGNAFCQCGRKPTDAELLRAQYEELFGGS